MRKRKAKKGYVYLLINDDNMYKYGCTKMKPEERAKRINYTNKQLGEFKLINFFKSCDIYDSERKLKWSLWANHMALSEFFYGDSDLINHIFNTEKSKHE